MGFVVFGSSCGHSYLAYWVLVIIWDTNPAWYCNCLHNHTFCSFSRHIHMSHGSSLHSLQGSTLKSTTISSTPITFSSAAWTCCSVQRWLGKDEIYWTPTALSSLKTLPPPTLSPPMTRCVSWPNSLNNTEVLYATDSLGNFLSTPTSTLTNGTTVLCYTYVHFVVT